MPKKNWFYQIAPCGPNSKVCENMGHQENCTLSNLSHLGQRSDNNVNYSANLRFLWEKQNKFRYMWTLGTVIMHVIAFIWNGYDLGYLTHTITGTCWFSMISWTDQQLTLLLTLTLPLNHRILFFLEKIFTILNRVSKNVAIFSCLWSYYKDSW